MPLTQSKNLRLENPAVNFGANLVEQYCENRLGYSCPQHQTVRSWQGNFGRKTDFRLEVLKT